MSRPVAGQQYTIVKGDTLSGISATVYGNGREWRRIWKANQTRLKSGNPDLIFPGEVIIIPGLPDVLPEPEEVLPFEPTQDATIMIDDRIVPVESATVFRSVDNALDGWSAELFLDPDDKDLLSLIAPYSYQSARAYLGKKLAITGYLYGVAPNTGEQRVALEGWSKPADMVDSTLKPGTYEAREIKLSQRAQDLADAHGIKVIYDLPEDGQFKRIKANATETIGTHLMSLAKQRGGLMTSTAKGELLFTQAATGDPVTTLEENTPPLLPTAARYDGRARYGSYLAIGQTSGKSKTATSVDTKVKNSRFLTFNAPDSRGGDIQSAADWQRGKVLADAMAIELPLSDWFDKDGNLFRENTIIEVYAPTLFIKEPTAFLIRAITYELSTRGRTAKLSIVPPGVYTGGEIEEPWLS